MFELPGAKRVRREELYDSSSDRHPSPEHESEVDAELRAKLNARLSSLLSLNLDVSPSSHGALEDHNTEAPPADNNDQDGSPADGDAREEAEFEFRLFSTSAVAPKVVLAPEEEEEAPFTGPAISQRPVSYHIRGELSPQERAKFRAAAVTGQQVLAWARQRAWGLEVPWRVTKITVTVGGKGAAVAGRQLPGVGGVSEEAEKVEKKKKTRPGKKTRIVLRKREKARKEAEAAREKQMMSKEEHLREKKKRLNREKKLKRRQKEKEKKLAASGGATGGGEGEAGPAPGSGSEGSDMDE